MPKETTKCQNRHSIEKKETHSGSSGAHAEYIWGQSDDRKEEGKKEKGQEYTWESRPSIDAGFEVWGLVFRV